MAHAVTRRSNGRNEMAAVEGLHVWWEGKQYGNANRLPKGASIEQWIEASGLNWSVKRARVRYPASAAMVDDNNALAAYRIIEDKHVLLRSDNGNALGIVSDGYKVVQPRQCFEFFRDVVESSGFTIHTAGSLHGGTKVWVQVEVGAEFIGKGDWNKGNVLLLTSFDYSSPTIAKGVDTSVVCQNTVNFALAEEGGKEVRVSHRTQFDAAAVQKKLGIAVDSYMNYIAQVKKLAAAKIDPATAEQIMLAAFGVDPVEDDENKVDAARESRGFKRVLALFNGEGMGSELATRNGTAWGAVNSVTEYVDHHIRARSFENRIDSAMFGAGSDMKSRAFQKALGLI